MIDWSALYRSFLRLDTVDTDDTKEVGGNHEPIGGGNLLKANLCVTSVNSVTSGKREGLPPTVGALSALEHRCPAYVDAADWQRAVEDGRRLLIRWGEQAEALGWAAEDLFGLPPVPDQPAPNYRRLSRYDLSGLIWLLRGRPVVALTTATAAIATPSAGHLTFYRRPC